MNTDLAPVEIYIPADAWLKPVAVPHSSACRETKPVTEYHAKKDSHAGICTRCKACVAIEKASKKHGTQDEKAAA
ncbi:hypothetical protein ACLRE5_003758 [Pseudomonas aeruginosa]